MMVDYVERYIHEVGRHLPRDQRDDVLAELRSHLLDTLEARSDGVEPTEALILDVLRESGPPRDVAASYAPTAQYLIGPHFYPIFIRVITVGLGWLIVLQVVRTLLAIGGGDGAPLSLLLDGIGELLSNGYTFAGVVVFIFAILERQGLGRAMAKVQAQAPGKPESAWDPRTLPEIVVGKEVNRGEIAFELAVALIGLGLLNAAVGGVNLGPNVVNLFSHPLLRNFVIAAAALVVLNGCLSVYLLYKGVWQMATRLILIAINVSWVVLLVQASGLDWRAIMVDLTSSAGLAELARFIPISLIISAVVVLFQTGKLIYDEVRRRQQGDSPSGNGGTVQARGLG
jgi:hypothetical protein